MIIKTDIATFIGLAQEFPVLDVRSPGEYSHAHIPGSYTLPLFTDEERKVVGTAYKQQGRETAIKIGLDYFGVKMRKMVEVVEEIIKNSNTDDKPTTANSLLIHCWRGGMRSAGVAWLLDLYGYKVYTLDGGYKAFRNWSLQQFSKPYALHVLGGYTGSGKTHVLHALSKAGQPTIDLEGLAKHKGSAFGGLGQEAQPSQEMFENKLAMALHQAGGSQMPDRAIWLEDESRRIGNVNIPDTFFENMRGSAVYFLDIPQESRLQLIMHEYAGFKNEALVTAIIRIRKRLGGLSTKQAINYLLEDNHKECFGILLSYYDKLYDKDMQQRNATRGLLTTIPCATTDSKTNLQKILSLNPA